MYRERNNPYNMGQQLQRRTKPLESEINFNVGWNPNKAQAKREPKAQHQPTSTSFVGWW
jgi:hypothetical protein